MINASYMYGGLSLRRQDRSRSSAGENIHFAAAIRWSGVINMSDAIGGVDVCVAGDINDPHTGLNLDDGQRTPSSGAEALQFLRTRHGIGDGSDLGRISNQQQFMSSTGAQAAGARRCSRTRRRCSTSPRPRSAGQQKQLVLEPGPHEPARSWCRSRWP